VQSRGARPVFRDILTRLNIKAAVSRSSHIKKSGKGTTQTLERVIECALMVFRHIRQFCIIAHMDHRQNYLVGSTAGNNGWLCRNARARAGARLDGSERERGHHDQAHPVTMTLATPRTGRFYEFEPDRHARPCGFRLRSVAQPGACEGALSWWTRSRASRRRLSPTHMASKQQPHICPDSLIRSIAQTPTSRRRKRQLEDILAIPGENGESWRVRRRAIGIN